MLAGNNIDEQHHLPINGVQALFLNILSFYLDRRMSWSQYIKNKNQDKYPILKPLLSWKKHISISLINNLRVYGRIIKIIWTYGMQLWSVSTINWHDVLIMMFYLKFELYSVVPSVASVATQYQRRVVLHAQPGE